MRDGKILTKKILEGEFCLSRGSTVWLNRVDDSLQVSLDGHSLAANEMVPLAPRQILAIETAIMEFIAFSQLTM